jgi:hypothetical protein
MSAVVAVWKFRGTGAGAALSGCAAAHHARRRLWACPAVAVWNAGKERGGWVCADAWCKGEARGGLCDALRVAAGVDAMARHAWLRACVHGCMERGAMLRVLACMGAGWL